MSIKITTPDNSRFMQEAITVDAVRLIKAKATQYEICPHLIQKIAPRENRSATKAEMRLATQARYETLLELLDIGYNKDLVVSIFKMSRNTLNAIIRKEKAACRPSRGHAQNDQRPRDRGDTNHRRGGARDPRAETPMIHCQNAKLSGDQNPKP